MCFQRPDNFTVTHFLSGLAAKDPFLPLKCRGLLGFILLVRETSAASRLELRRSSRRATPRVDTNPKRRGVGHVASSKVESCSAHMHVVYGVRTKSNNICFKQYNIYIYNMYIYIYAFSAWDLVAPFGNTQNRPPVLTSLHVCMGFWIPT